MTCDRAHDVLACGATAADMIPTYRPMAMPEIPLTDQLAWLDARIATLAELRATIEQTFAGQPLTVATAIAPVIDPTFTVCTLPHHLATLRAIRATVEAMRRYQDALARWA